MRTLEDLSAKDGELLLVEYSEEYPPLLSQVNAKYIILFTTRFFSAMDLDIWNSESVFCRFYSLECVHESRIITREARERMMFQQMLGSENLFMLILLLS